MEEEVENYTEEELIADLLSFYPRYEEPGPEWVTSAFAAKAWNVTQYQAELRLDKMVEDGIYECREFPSKNGKMGKRYRKAK